MNSASPLLKVMATVPSMISTPLSQRILSIFKPFSTQLWMTILGLVLLSTLLIYIFEVRITWGRLR